MRSKALNIVVAFLTSIGILVGSVGFNVHYHTCAMTGITRASLTEDPICGHDKIAKECKSAKTVEVAEVETEPESSCCDNKIEAEPISDCCGNKIEAEPVSDCCASKDEAPDYNFGKTQVNDFCCTSYITNFVSNIETISCDCSAPIVKAPAAILIATNTPLVSDNFRISSAEPKTAESPPPIYIGNIKTIQHAASSGIAEDNSDCLI